MNSVKLITAMMLAVVVSRSMAQEHQHGTDEKLGAVHFATSCNEAAQKEFDRAVALLHSFQFSRAIEGFNAVLGEDPTCAIAYWGIALSDWSNPFAPGMKDKGQLQPGGKSAERGKTAGRKDGARAGLRRGRRQAVQPTSRAHRSERACSPIATPCGSRGEISGRP